MTNGADHSQGNGGGKTTAKETKSGAKPEAAPKPKQENAKEAKPQK
jgi:hypothetical protein